jgi:hypothetical protein
LGKAELEAMAREATVDCYDESEQVSGFYTMIADNLEVPFGTKVLGVDVLVEDIDLKEDGATRAAAYLMSSRLSSRACLAVGLPAAKCRYPGKPARRGLTDPRKHRS